MSTYDLDLKLQQSSCQSGVKASVTCVLSDQERFYTHTDKSRFQNESEQEKLNPGPSAQHIHNKKDLETGTTASSPALPLTGQQKSSKNLQVKQIILLRTKRDSSRTSEEQTESDRFTSTISISLPTRTRKKDTAEEKPLQVTTNLYNTHEVVKNTANQHGTEIRDVFSPAEKCDKSTGELFKLGDGPKATFDGDSFTILHQHVHNTPKQGQNTGIQHNIGLHEQSQIIHDSLRHSTQPVCEVETEVNKDFGSNDCGKNASTTAQYHNNLTSIGVDNGLKESSDSKLVACHAEVLNQVLTLASFTAPASDNTPEPEPSLFNPSSAMLTSTLASVLAPPWSGRLRRPKQGSNEVPQDCGQNINPSSLFHQDRQQPLFLRSQRQPSEHMLASNNQMQLTAGTGFNSPDWQKENNSPNVTTTVQPKRPILKSSVGTMYNTELHSFSTPLDTCHAPNSAHSGHRISQTGEEHEPFKSLSSKPTTSSLLLSLRRTNLRNSSFEPTQTQTPITRSVRSLTLPSRSVLNTQSFPQSVNAEDQTAKYPDTPTRTEEIQVSQFPFSPRIKSRKPLTTTLFLNKPETEMSKTLEASGARAEEEHFPQSMTKTGQIGVKAQQNSYSVLLRKYSSTEDIYLEEQITVNSTNLQNFSINKQKISQHTTISPKDSTNFNIQQSGFNAQYLKSQSTQNTTARNSSGASTFTDRLNYSPRKDSSVDGISPTVGQIYLDSKKHSQSSQSSMDLSSPLSPSRPLRSVRVPSIYSYLRESSPAVSTPFPSTPSPHIQRAETLPPKQDGGVTRQSDQKTFPSRFSFDSPFVPEVQALQRNSYGSSAHTAPAQSLPPDFGRGSAPRLSTSPYSGLISSRPALNNTLQGLSSPPVSNIHTRSTSYDIVSTQADLIKGDPSSSLSTYTKITRRPKEQIASPNREQRTSVQAYTSTLDNHRPAQPCLSQTAPDASFVMESQSANINPHPRQPNTGSNNFPHQEHDGLTALQLDKGNAYPKQRMSEKEKYLLHNKLPVKNETPLTAEKKTTAGHMHEKLQEMQSPNSKKGLFASRVKKDNTFSSASLPEKEVVSPQYLKTKRHSPVFKTSSRIDQIINRLKLTFGVKRSDSTLDTITKKNKPPTQKHSDTETFEKPKTEEKTYSGNQREPSISSLTTDKPSFSSLSPLTKSDNTINMDWQKSSTTEQKCSGCAWEAPNSSLTTDKPYFATFGSLSPPTLMKSENTLNMDWQNRSTTEQKCSGCTWEAPNSNLTTDQAYFTSFGSLSSLTLKRSSENKLNVDQQKRHSDETGNRSYSRSFSPHRIKTQSMNRSATLPNYRKSSVCPPSSPFYLFDFNSEDIHNDNVFYSPVSKKTNSLCESEDFSPLSSAKNAVQQNLARSRLSLSCADLKYGLHNGRSFSVSSVVSSRPSGPGRISTSSISDLSSLDDFVPKESYTVDSPVSSSYSPSYEPKSVSGKESQPGYTDDHLDHDDADPTPPPSPTLSSSPRRISQAPAMSSHMRTTSDNLSPPRGILPSRSYKTSLTVFEESGSDTTTDDEYYVDSGDDDEVETEL